MDSKGGPRMRPIDFRMDTKYKGEAQVTIELRWRCHSAVAAGNGYAKATKARKKPGWIDSVNGWLPTCPHSDDRERLSTDMVNVRGELPFLPCCERVTSRTPFLDH